MNLYYVLAFLLGVLGSIGYFLGLTLHGRLESFKTKQGKVRKALICILCVMGGFFAAALQHTIKDNLALAHAFLIGFGWILLLVPTKHVVLK